MQCQNYFLGYCSSRDQNLEANGSIFPLNNPDTILSNGGHRHGNSSSSSPDLHLGYNKEVLKQTMLEHEAIFRDQIHELHRIYWRQKELMDEARRTELYHLQVETLHSNPVLSKNTTEHVLKTSHSTSFPWVNPSCSMSSISESKRSLLPWSCADGKRVTPTGPEHAQNEASAKDAECKKLGKRILDLELPACEYVDSEEEDSSEEEKVSEVLQMPTGRVIGNDKRTFEVISKSDRESSLGNSDFQQNNSASSVSLKLKCLVDLNEPIDAEEKADPESSGFLDPVSGQRKIQCQDLSGKAYPDFQVSCNEINGDAQTRDDLEPCSKDESGRSGIDLNSFPGGSCAEKSSVFELNQFKQTRELTTSNVSTQSNRKSCNESLQNFGRDLSASRDPEPAAISSMHTSCKLVPRIDMEHIESSSVLSWRKPDLEQVPMAVEALQCLKSAVSSNLLIRSPELAGDKFLENNKSTSGRKAGNADFSWSRFCNGSQVHSDTLEIHKLPSNFGCLKNCHADNDSASEGHNPTKFIKISMDARPGRDVNLNSVSLGCSLDVSVSQNNLNGGKKLENSIRREPWLGGKPVRKPDNASEHLTSVPGISNCLFSSYASLVKINHNLSEGKDYQRNEKEGILDVNLDCDPLSDSEEKRSASEPVVEKGLDKKISGFKVCIDLNSCISRDEDSVTPSLSTEIDLEAPVSPENKESNRPRGEPDENQASPGNKVRSLLSGESDENKRSPEKDGTPVGDHDENRSSVDKECSAHRAGSDENISTQESKESSPLREDSYEGQSSLVNKKSSPPEREHYENQLKVPFLSSEQEDEDLLEDLVRIAAEAMVTISSSGLQTWPESHTSWPTRGSQSGYLDWFARVASSVKDDSNSEFGLVLNGKDGGDLEDYLPDGLDYFEAMTLQLTETNMEEYWCKPCSPKLEETIDTLLPSKPRRGRTRRGRQQRKDFQSEILPSLASLSRYEVTEDLQTIGGLMEAAGTRWETSSNRNTVRNGFFRGRRRSCTSTFTVIEPTASSLLKERSNTTEIHTEERKPIDWGKITRRRRGPRCPTSNPRLILGQV